MLLALSVRYQKEIALFFLSVFATSGWQSLKAQNQRHFYGPEPIQSASIIGGRFAGGNPMGFAPIENKFTPTLTNPGAPPEPRFEALTTQATHKPQIGGPSQPEMTSFKSVGADNMVSPFTGDFSYNIPLFDVGGYPINMFYNSGITMEQEASWVGLGWNINPGTITRNMRGLPDDFDGRDKIVKDQSFRADETFGVNVGANLKFAGFPIAGAGINMGLSWNNKLGVAAEAGLNAALSISGKSADKKTYALTASAGVNASSRAGASFSPGISIDRELGKGQFGPINGSIGAGYTYSSRVGLSSMHLDMNVSQKYTMVNNDGDADTRSASLGSSSGTLSFAYPSVVPSIRKSLTRQNYSLEFSAGFENWALNPNLKLKGYFTRTFIDPHDQHTTHPAYGMLYLGKAEGKTDALVDFNRANEGVYTPNNPAISMPVYTYDVFSITGEGTGGSFRAYRGDIGHMRDPEVASKDDQYGLGVDLGFANLVHVGADLNYISSPSSSGDWILNNQARSAFSFTESNGGVQSVYFKNPSEKTVPDKDFQEALCGEELVRFKLGNAASANPMLLSKLVRYDAGRNYVGEQPVSQGQTRKMNRDRRTQVISFLTAEEADRIGITKRLYSYSADGNFANSVLFSSGCNSVGITEYFRNHEANPPGSGSTYNGFESSPFRRKNHISQIDVLGTDGKKYLYGVPVYNTKQVNVTFSVEANQKKSNTKAEYKVLEKDNTTENTKGRDAIYEREEIPPYAHSFLLSGITSPNYVDLTGDGITDDDMGDAIKFNYTKYSDYKWRTPVDQYAASYSAGLKTDEKDDKAHYVYGERESWYLYSVESKNMVARFFLADDRKDGKQVQDENGGVDANSGGMKRLQKISLYSKGDLVKLGSAARPIKTVIFFQSYKLCVNNPTSDPNQLSSNIESGSGKLTLDSIWICYNGIESRPKSRYKFSYSDNNPTYSFEESDRWGNFKPHSQNPNGLSNEEYPYALQGFTPGSEAQANSNAGAWAMNRILLPSGGVITVDYEADQYAYVQNKKAATMCTVLGFGTSTASLPSSAELPYLYNNDHSENDIVYVQLPFAILSNTKNELGDRYFVGLKQLLLRLAVKMPTGYGLSGIAGEENIPVYADISDYGLISSNIAWVRVARLTNAHTPMVQAALQFLTQQLPGKAYKGYDLSESGGAEAIVRALAGMLSSVGSMVNGEIYTLKDDHKCQQVELKNCFARLVHPTRMKYGGGHRVRKVTLYDSWDKMTGQRESTYGQEYKYETTELINGELKTISSGVAAWEPSVGSDENPFKEVVRFLDHNRGGPYDFGTVEQPLGESFYPGPMVGYSRVEVLSIHRDHVKNPPTRQVTEFYTNKDFPYTSRATDLVGDANVRYEPPKIMQLLQIDMMKGIAQSQGFVVETNDMNGKEKRQAVYTVTDPANPVSQTEYFYNTKPISDNTFGFTHSFPAVSGPDGKVAAKLIGRDVEVMTDFRQHHSEAITANLSINFDGFMVGVFPMPLTNLLRPVVREGTMYRSAALLKVVTHYGILDSVRVINKGSAISTKNLVYDAETGNPILTRTQNEHNKAVYNISYPAHWAYSGMGGAYKNIDANYQHVKFSHGILTENGGDIFGLLESGDELYVNTEVKGEIGQAYAPPCDDQASITSENAYWNSLANRKQNRIWAVNTGKSGDGSNVWVFMDAGGKPYNGVDVTVRIVRSGHRNMMDQVIGTITSLANPITEVTDPTTNKIDSFLTFNDTKAILQASAATFKDNWRVDNSFFKVTEDVTQVQQARVHRQDFRPNTNDDITVAWNLHNNYYNRQDHIELDNRNILKGDALSTFKESYSRTEHQFLGYTHFYYGNHRQISFIRYDLNNTAVPVGDQVYKGMLTIYSHNNFPRFQPATDYKDARHDGMHDNASGQKVGILGEVRALNKTWFGVDDNLTNANAWINTYFNSNLANVSYGRGILPTPFQPWVSYVMDLPVDQRVNVTLPIMTANGPLKQANKVGLKLSLFSDEKGPENYGGIAPQYRCFWSQRAQTYCESRTTTSGQERLAMNSPGGCVSFAIPTLSYYSYSWGDMRSQTDFTEDPDVNKVITKVIRTINATYCKSKFLEKAINPYVEGALGNWRPDTTYVYYGERREKSVTSDVDTRVGGLIKDFKTFWNFVNSTSSTSTLPLQRNPNATNVWVWNSTTTQFNKKGYEVENTDPLGRFNSGLYGYNQQLPIAVANNSRVREILFDGFEDYDYTTGDGCISCRPRRHFYYNTPVTSLIDPGQKHTGRYSLRVDGGKSVSISAPVTDLAASNQTYGLNIKGSSTTYTSRYLNGGTIGSGLNASWYNHAVTDPQYYKALTPAPSSVYPQATLVYSEVGVVPNIPHGDEQNSPKFGVSPEFFSVRWEGKIQAPRDGVYTFRVVSDNGCRIKIGTYQTADNAYWDPTCTSGPACHRLVNGQPFTVALTAGEVYPIQIDYYTGWGGYQFDLQWKEPGKIFFSQLPTKYLYPPNATSFQTVAGIQNTCYRLDESQVTGNALTDTFSLIQKRKMVLSAWVKVGTLSCCFPETYNNGTNNVQIKFTDASGTQIGSSASFTPSGAIIEGWQRYEAVFIVPDNASSISVSLNNLQAQSTDPTKAVYFDDLRIHPFVGNMKTFVHHGSSLRLMAELDENNYATFYEYDDDGTLSRVKKETTQGIKTVTETRSATLRKPID